MKMAEIVADPLFQANDEAIRIESPEAAKEPEEKLLDSDITTADENITNTNKQEDEPPSTESSEALESLPLEVAVNELLAGDPKNELEDANEDESVVFKDNAAECEDGAKTEAPLCDIRTEIGNKLKRRPVPFTRTARYRFARALKRRSIKL